MRTFRIIGVVGTAALLLSASVVFAEERPKNVELRTGESRAKVATTTRMLGETKEAAKERLEAVRKEVKDKMEAAREEARARMEVAREEAKTRIAEKREKAEKRVADIQDKVKKQMAEKIAKQLERLNSTWTGHFMNVLERYDAIVLKMQDRSAKAAAAGRDITAANTAIEAAKTAVASAKTAVIAQAAKAYALDTAAVTTTVATTTPTGQGELIQSLRKAFQNLHTSLFKDLFALRDGAMKDARGAVQNALQALGKVPKVDDDTDDETATSTSTSS